MNKFEILGFIALTCQMISIIFQLIFNNKFWFFLLGLGFLFIVIISFSQEVKE